VIGLRATCAVLVAGAMLLSGCAERHAAATQKPAGRTIIVDDRDVGTSTNQFMYSGRWETVRGRHDGRHDGTSTRSFRPGDTMTLSYFGRRCELFGVVGPGGGAATVVDGTIHTIDFHARAKQMKRVYVSPLLPEGPHTMVVTVGVLPKGLAPNGFVNIDYARIEP
jgi:hypothetical protein